jgi:hypothetical protein
MNLKNYKFINYNGHIYSISFPKWKKHLKSILAYKLSLLKKKPLPEPLLSPSDIKIVAYDIFEFGKLDADDCVDITKEELRKIENGQ